MEEATANSIARASRRPSCGRQHARRGRGWLAIRGLAATLAAGALVVPAVASATPSVIAQAKAAMQRATVTEEAHHEIPFKRGTKFTITCAIKRQVHDVLCNEHAGPQQCTNGRPWTLLSDDFPIIGGNRVGASLTITLVETDEYCTTS